jgi:hypothetical protein
MSEGTTGDNPSAELTIGVQRVDPNIISDTHGDIAPIANYAIHELSTSNDEASIFPSDDTEAAADQINNIVDVDPHLQSESDSEVDSENSQVDLEIPDDIEDQYRARIWLNRMRIQNDVRSPVYCPAHNDLYLNFVRQQEQHWNPRPLCNDRSSIDRLTLNGPLLNLEGDLEQQQQQQPIIAVNALLYDDGKQRYNPTARSNNRSSLD